MDIDIMKLWIARDYKCDYNKEPRLTIFYDKPYINDNDWWHWKTHGKFKVINKNLFPEVTYENSPQEVELKLVENLITKEWVMRYKKGDRVRIKSLEWYYANKNSEGAIIFNNFRIFNESMSEFCGKVVTIDAYVPQGDYYEVKEDGNLNFWSDDMFEGLAIKEPQEKMVSLEKMVEYLEANFPDIENVGSWRKESFIRDFRKAMEK